MAVILSAGSAGSLLSATTASVFSSSVPWVVAGSVSGASSWSQVSAGVLPLLVETERALLEKGKESLCLTLQYRLILAGEDQGRARLKVKLLY